MRKNIITFCFIFFLVWTVSSAYGANGDSPFKGNVPVPPAPLTAGDIKSIVKDVVSSEIKPVTQRLEKLEKAKQESDGKISTLETDTSNLKSDNEANKAAISNNSAGIADVKKDVYTGRVESGKYYNSLFDLIEWFGWVLIVIGGIGFIGLFFWIMGRK